MPEGSQHYCPDCDVIVWASEMIADGICPYCGGPLDMEGEGDDEADSD